MKKILILSTALVFNVLITFGQQILTLDESISKALNNKSSLQRASLEVSASQNQLDLTRRKFAPEIAGQLTLQYNPIIATSIIPVGQFNAQNPTDETRAVQFGLPLSNSAGITATQTLFDASLNSEMKERKLELLVNERSRDQEREKIIDEVSRAYFQLFLAEGELIFAAGDTLRARMQFQLASDRFDQQQIKEVEKRQAQFALQNARYNFEKVFTSVKNARATLAYHIGLPVDSIVGLSTDPGLLVLQQDESANISIKERADYQLKQSELALNEQQILTARSKLLPVITANAFLGANQFSNSFDVAESNSWFGNAFINLSVQLPISAWYRESKKIQQSKTRLQQRELELKEIKEKFDLEANTAANNLQVSRLQYQNQLLNLSVAKEIYNDVLNNFRQGRALSSDVQNADVTVRQAQYEVLKAIYDALISKLELQRLSGFPQSAFTTN